MKVVFFFPLSREEDMRRVVVDFFLCKRGGEAGKEVFSANEKKAWRKFWCGFFFDCGCNGHGAFPSQVEVGKASSPSFPQPVTRGGQQVGEWAWGPGCVVPLGHWQGHSPWRRWALGLGWETPSGGSVPASQVVVAPGVFCDRRTQCIQLQTGVCPSARGSQLGSLQEIQQWW